MGYVIPSFLEPVVNVGLTVRSLVDQAAFFVADATPIPEPLPVPETIDPNRVSPGMLGLLAVLVLAAAAALIYVFLRGSLRKIDFNEEDTIDESKPLDDYRPPSDDY